jgi:hypothetical protein
MCCAVLGQAQKQLLDDEKREYLWKVLEMARGDFEYSTLRHMQAPAAGHAARR